MSAKHFNPFSRVSATETIYDPRTWQSVEQPVLVRRWRVWWALLRTAWEWSGRGGRR